MPKLSALLMSACLVSGLAWSQGPAQQEKSSPTPQQTPSPSPRPSTALPALVGFGLEDGTPIKLRLTRNLSSGTDKKGDTVDFEVLEDVSVQDVIVIPRGSTAWATITEAQPKRRMGRGGKLDVNIDAVRLKDGERANLRAIKENKGGGHVGAMTGAMVATGIVFFPAAPLFLFMHGKDINIPKGTEITAYVAGNIPLDKAKFEGGGTSSTGSSATASPLAAGSAVQVTISITSTPPGADVEVDGKFVGNTPSSLALGAGDHTIKVTKKGYKNWERTLSASSGNVNVTAELEADK